MPTRNELLNEFHERSDVIRQAMEKGLLDMDDATRMIDEHRLVVEHQITLVDNSVAARKARQKKLKAQITREVEKFLATVDDEAPVEQPATHE